LKTLMAGPEGVFLPRSVIEVFHEEANALIAGGFAEQAFRKCSRFRRPSALFNSSQVRGVLAVSSRAATCAVTCVVTCFPDAVGREVSHSSTRISGGAAGSEHCGKQKCVSELRTSPPPFAGLTYAVGRSGPRLRLSAARARQPGDDPEDLRALGAGRALLVADRNWSKMAVHFGGPEIVFRP
jgi:hypothetical protein